MRLARERRCLRTEGASSDERRCLFVRLPCKRFPRGPSPRMSHTCIQEVLGADAARNFTSSSFFLLTSDILVFLFLIFFFRVSFVPPQTPTSKASLPL